ncbi:MAG: pyridoxamine 5'-phosphate oxidase family protein [Pseudonocardia sp.]|jgi:uncharacterized protein
MDTVSRTRRQAGAPLSDAPLSGTPRSTLGRHRERARIDRAELYSVLDEGLICHLGVLLDGAPVVLPTCYGRLEDTLYLHGSTGASSMQAGPGQPVCVTVTLLDGLVYSRAVFSHSANFRSAVVHGVPRPVTDEAGKLRGLRAIVDHTTPGSWDHARRPDRRELAATAVLALDLAEASVKVRGGPPGDADADLGSGAAWAGVLPVRTVFGTPEPCPLLPATTVVPAHVAGRDAATPASARG